MVLKVAISGIPRGYQFPRSDGNWLTDYHKEKILSLSKKGTRKTRILYQGNFSYKQLQEYLPYLIEKDVIEKREIRNNGHSSIYYYTTEKGAKLYQAINTVLSQLKK